MPITEAERRFIDEVSLNMPWSLVETFSTMPRWRPEDVNRGMDTLVQRLRRCAQVELMRGQNRFVAALDQARRMVEAVAGQ